MKVSFTHHSPTHTTTQNNVLHPPQSATASPAPAEADETLLDLLSQGDWFEAPHKAPEPKVWDESLRAHLLRQGRSGLTNREGRRRKEFRTETDLTFPIPFKGQTWPSWEKELNGYLVGLALRVMRLDGLTPTTKTTKGDLLSKTPSVEQVALSIYEKAFQEGRAWIEEDTTERVRYTMGKLAKGQDKWFSGSLPLSMLDKKTDDAASYAWDIWSDEYLKNLSVWGAKGGRLSKKTPTYTVELLDDLLGLTVPQQADALGCSTSTIDSLRSRHIHYRTTQNKPQLTNSSKTSEKTMPGKNPTRRSNKKTAAELAAELGISVSTLRRRQSEPLEDFSARAKARRTEALRLKNEGLTVPQVAAEMGIEPGAAQALIYRARKELRA